VICPSPTSSRMRCLVEGFPNAWWRVDIYIKLIFGQSIFYQYKVNKTKFLLYHITYTRLVDNLPPQSLSMTNSASSVAPARVSTQPSSTINRMLYMERLVIELSNPDLRENALCVLSKVVFEFFPSPCPKFGLQQ
jgi:hypothetical protein